MLDFVLGVGALLAFCASCANVVCGSVEAEAEAAPAAACEVRLRTDAGWLCGRVRVADGTTKYASFRSVPYGKPPVGERRFKELEPVDPWNGFLDATEDSPACPQKEQMYGRITQQIKGQSEDCIYLNLHVPYEALPKADVDKSENNIGENPGLPILVMIHGGGFQVGSGLTDLHGPEYLMRKDVIVVTFNYRINVFGFLSLGTKDVPGNQGLRDQVMLLRWVQRNVRAFGGDPDNVTLMGQSAGAGCTHILSLSRAAKGLFHRIILMSGTAIPNYFSASPKFAKLIADKFLAHADIVATDPDEVYKQLIEMPLVNIMQANSIMQHEFGLTSFVPVVEDEYPNVTRILDREPLELIAKGRGKEYPLLIGFTDKEAEFFRWVCLNMDVLNRVKENPKLLLPTRLMYSRPSQEQTELANEIRDRYFNGTPTLGKYIEHLSDKFFKYPGLKVAAWRAKSGAPVYLYQYAYKSQKSIIKEGLWTNYEGGAHVEDLTYVFRVNSMMGDYVSFPATTNDDRMRDRMTTMITNFMKCSNPTCSKDESQWPPLSEDRMQYQYITEPAMHQMVEPTNKEVEMVRFFDTIDLECRHVSEQLKQK